MYKRDGLMATDNTSLPPVGVEKHRHFIADEDTYTVHTHLPRKIGQQKLTALELHPKQRIGQSLNDLPFYFRL